VQPTVNNKLNVSALNGLNSNIKGSRLEIIKEADHGFYDSNPEEFQSLVLDFLKNEKD